MDRPGEAGGGGGAAQQKIQVQSLGGEDPTEKGMTTHSSILAWRIPMDRGADGL